MPHAKFQDHRTSGSGEDLSTNHLTCYSFPNGGERGGLVVNALDSGSRGRRFEPHSGQTVLCP